MYRFGSPRKRRYHRTVDNGSTSTGAASSQTLKLVSLIEFNDLLDLHATPEVNDLQP